MANYSDMPGPCSKRQDMYMFRERYAKDKDGNRVKEKVDVTLFGGAAGSGKSEIGVIDFLKYTDIPNFIGVITRRTTPQLHGPGGILTKCRRVFSKVYGPDECIWRAKDGKFVFPHSGAEIYLRHFEDERAADNWQGSEANLYYIDEATQFTKFMVQYIMSRMRNPSCPQVKPHLKMTCNPDESHFLKDWVVPYLQEDGTPDRSKDGWVRYFTFYDGDFVWGDSREELAKRYGIKEEDALSFTFISANVFDNPIVQEINPQYVSWLKGLRGVEKERLLNGNWYVREESSTYFNRDWCEEITYLDESEVLETVRTFDMAGTLPSDLNRSPDYTATVRMRKTKDGDYIVDDARRTRIRHGEWVSFILTCAENDPPNTRYYIPEDPNPMAKKANALLIKELIEAGLDARRIKTSNTGKLDRFRPFSAMAEIGGIKFLENCGIDYANNVINSNDFLYRELEVFTGQRRRGEAFHDDLADCCSDAFYVLASDSQHVGNIGGGLSGLSRQLKIPSNFPA